jgi:hypothetical protein
VSNIYPRVSYLSDARQISGAVNHALKQTDSFSLSADQLTVQIDRDAALTGNFDVTGFYTVGGVQVVGPRQTGWAADTGTAEKTTHTTYAAGTTLTFSAGYVQSELTALATRLAAVETALQGSTRSNMAVKSALITHGLIGS